MVSAESTEKNCVHASNNVDVDTAAAVDVNILHVRETVHHILTGTSLARVRGRSCS